MSAPGPESIPTSADPRSKRPVKKRAVTPTSSQASSISSLFSKPDQPVRIPPLRSSSFSSASASQRSRLPPPPEIVTNVQGSSAGAGSGEFHVYKASRRREYERLRVMDEELRAQNAKEEFERNKAERQQRDDEKTRKNREKREKKKRAKEKARHEKASGGAQDQDEGSRESGNGNIETVGIKARVDSKDGHKGVEQDKSKASATQDAAHPTPAVPAFEPQGIVIHDED